MSRFEKIQVPAELKRDDIIYAVLCLDHEAIEEFILEIDTLAADYDFTLSLARRLVAEIVRENAAEGVDFNLADLLKGQK